MYYIQTQIPKEQSLTHCTTCYQYSTIGSTCCSNKNPNCLKLLRFPFLPRNFLWCYEAARLAYIASQLETPRIFIIEANKPTFPSTMFFFFYSEHPHFVFPVRAWNLILLARTSVSLLFSLSLPHFPVARAGSTLRGHVAEKE